MMKATWKSWLDSYERVGNRLVGYNEKDAELVRGSKRRVHLYGEVYWIDMDGMDIVLREDESKMYITTKLNIGEIKQLFKKLGEENEREGNEGFAKGNRP